MSGRVFEADGALPMNLVAVAYGDVFEEMVALSQELGFGEKILGET